MFFVWFYLFKKYITLMNFSKIRKTTSLQLQHKKQHLKQNKILSIFVETQGWAITSKHKL